jgi:tetratricopeptide (TPR) repeat protein
VLRRARDGLWYIDEPKSWTYFHRFEDGNDFFPKYDDLPFLKELVSMEHPHSNQPLYPVPTPPVISYPFSLSEHIATLERKIESDPANDKIYAELGEVYLFEMDWIRKALEFFEKAASLNPQKAEYHWRLYDLYMNDSQMEKALNELKFLAKAVSNDTRAKEWYKFYSRSYQFKRGEF